MKHYIIVKFKDRTDTQRLLPEITDLFRQALSLEGVEDVNLFPSCSARENRYSLMIEMILSPEGLDNWDASPIHKAWKSGYGDRLESKAIFDCE